MFTPKISPSFVLAAGIAAANLVTTNLALAQDYYRWIDENGVTQYSQQPPEGHPDLQETSLAITPLTVGIQQSRDQDLPAQGSTEGVNQGDGSAADLLNSFGKDPEICAQALQSLQTMNEFENIVMTDPSTGNGVYLSESERAAEQVRLEGMRDYYCAN